MRIVVAMTLFTISILLIIILIYIGRELHKIRVLISNGADQLVGYLNVVLCNEEEPSIEEKIQNSVNDSDVRVTDEEKELLWQIDAEQLLNEVIGDIF